MRVYDTQLRVLAWFEDWQAGGIATIALSQRLPKDPDLPVPLAVVATTRGTLVGWDVASFVPGAAAPPVVAQLLNSPVGAMAVHAQRNWLAVGGGGQLQLWDWLSHRLLTVRWWERQGISAVAFAPQGAWMAVGFASGSLRFIIAASLAESRNVFRLGSSSISHVVFSASGDFLAVADNEGSVALYKLGNLGTEWAIVGKSKAHRPPMLTLHFSSSDPLVVWSMGADRRLVEIDVNESSIEGGLQIKRPLQLSPTLTPVAVIPMGLPSEEALWISTNDYKFKIFNARSKLCKQTVLSPTFGGALHQ